MKYILLLFVGVVLFGCSKKFVTLYPEGQVNEGNFYTSGADFQEALVGAYAPLRDAANVAFFLEEMRSDNTFFDYNAKDRGGTGVEELAEFLDNSGNTTIQAIWTADYSGIQRTNVILDKMSKPPADMTDSARNQVVGQAKALRAHYYFELVRLFGSIPVYLHETTNAQTAVVNRSSVDAVYTQIQADLNDALGLLPAPSKFPQSGAVTKGMVATELGLVYLTLKQYDKATPLFQSVTQMGYSLLPHYADVFKTANKNSSESVFEIQFKSGTDKQQSQFIYYFIPTTPATGNILGSSANYNNTEGSNDIPTQNLVKAYEPGDTRLDASIGVIKGHLNPTNDFLPDSVVSILNNIDTTGKGYGYTTSPAHRFIRKFFNPPYTTALIYNTDDNWPVYRYADVLLMLAESLNEQGQSGAALPFLNQVRARAGLPASTASGQAALRDTIMHERRVELAFENKRWFDLVRTGQAVPVMTAFGIAQKAAFPFLLPTAYNVTDSKLIYAIPFRETTVNPGLGQNPGY